MHKSLPTLPAGASAAERYFSERYPGYRLKDYRTDPLTHTVSCFVLEPLDAAYRCRLSMPQMRHRRLAFSRRQSPAGAGFRHHGRRPRAN